MEIYAINPVINGLGGTFLVTNTFSLVAAATMVILILSMRRIYVS